MRLIKLRSGDQITLPGAVRRALGVREGDYLEAEVIDQGVLLRPAAGQARASARARLKATLSRSRYIGTRPEPSEDEFMRLVVSEIKDTRRKAREGGSR